MNISLKYGTLTLMLTPKLYLPIGTVKIKLTQKKEYKLASKFVRIRNETGIKKVSQTFLIV